MSAAKEKHDFKSDDFSVDDIMRLAKAGKAFDFWKEPGEDIYILTDGQPVSSNVSLK